MLNVLFLFKGSDFLWVFYGDWINYTIWLINKHLMLFWFDEFPAVSKSLFNCRSLWISETMLLIFRTYEITKIVWCFHVILRWSFVWPKDAMLPWSVFFTYPTIQHSFSVGKKKLGYSLQINVVFCEQDLFNRATQKGDVHAFRWILMLPLALSL